MIISNVNCNCKRQNSTLNSRNKTKKNSLDCRCFLPFCDNFLYFQIQTPKDTISPSPLYQKIIPRLGMRLNSDVVIWICFIRVINYLISYLLTSVVRRNWLYWIARLKIFKWLVFMIFWLNGTALTNSLAQKSSCDSGSASKIHRTRSLIYPQGLNTRIF